MNVTNHVALEIYIILNFAYEIRAVPSKLPFEKKYSFRFYYIIVSIIVWKKCEILKIISPIIVVYQNEQFLNKNKIPVISM